ncbi:hypothetical protein [Kitasatospora herbaricolor]|uniref:Uncharacterized protein n=1 Tax=Kitasatospora herbaricolor TaxID=68217 RepID=A0ABZ1WCP0_9ACTN|nr:hypothetical protein [Kitasatospora herbaricolor]
MSRDETSGLRAALLRLGRLPGYVRQPDLARRSGEQGHTYKKGWEVRFTARTEDEIAEIRGLVVAAGFTPARPFFKGHQLIQPVYGMAVVQAYLAARQTVEENAARAARGRRADGTPEAGPETARADGSRAGTARAGAASTRSAGTRNADTDSAGTAGTDGARSDTARTVAAASAAASAAAAAAASAAAAAASAQRARRRAVEGFPAQVERTTAADRMDCSDRARKTGPAGSAPQGAGRTAADRTAADRTAIDRTVADRTAKDRPTAGRSGTGTRVGAAEAGLSC